MCNCSVSASSCGHFRLTALLFPSENWPFLQLWWKQTVQLAWRLAWWWEGRCTPAASPAARRNQSQPLWCWRQWWPLGSVTQGQRRQLFLWSCATAQRERSPLWCVGARYEPCPTGRSSFRKSPLRENTPEITSLPPSLHQLKWWTRWRAHPRWDSSSDPDWGWLGRERGTLRRWPETKGG